MRLSRCSITKEQVLLGGFAWIAGKGLFVIIRYVDCFFSWEGDAFGIGKEKC